MRSFKSVILLFSLIYLLEHDFLALTLKFLIDEKLEFETRFGFLEIIGNWTFCEQRWLHGWSIVLMDLDVRWCIVMVAWKTWFLVKRRN